MSKGVYYGEPKLKAEHMLIAQSTKTKTGCIEWQGARIHGGYGQTSELSVKILTHVFIYKTLIGPIPEGMQVCHMCDNPPCINPQHLFLGTAHDNAIDAAKKGRRKGNPKLSPELREKLVKDISLGWSYRTLANKYSLSIGQIARISKANNLLRGPGNRRSL